MVSCDERDNLPCFFSVVRVYRGYSTSLRRDVGREHCCRVRIFEGIQRLFVAHDIEARKIRQEKFRSIFFTFGEVYLYAVDG